TETEPLVFDPEPEVLELSRQGGLAGIVQPVAATVFTALIFVLPVLFILAFVYLPSLRVPLALYVVFCYNDPAISNGVGRPALWVRRLGIWRHISAYFPVRVVLEQRLDPKQSYLLGIAPHGILAFGGQVAMGSQSSALYRALEGTTVHVAALRPALTLPVFRDYLLALGAIASSRAAIRECLARGKGHSVGIVVGGAKESLYTNPGHRKIVMRHRKGFVREAIMAGAPLVPVYVFGENDIFTQVMHPPLRRLQKWLQTKVKFALPVFYGRLGMVPRRSPLTVAIGTPIAVPKIEAPTADEIDRVHADFILQMGRLYSRFQPIYDPEGGDL
ncbi:hypothetical protein EC988_008146, partial [Linderina pennispora]